MCNPVTWWYVKHGESRTLFISEKSDSHTETAKEFGIKDTGMGSVCAGEFRPDPIIPSPDPSTWLLVWDYQNSDRRPDWVDDEEQERLRSELERRVKRYVYTEGEHVADSCRAFVFGTANVTLTGGTAWFYNKSTGTVNSGTAVFCNDSTGTVNGGTAVFCNDSTGTVNGGEAMFYDNSTGTVNGGEAVFYGNSTGTVNGGEAVFYGNSTGTVNGGTAWFYGNARRLN